MFFPPGFSRTLDPWAEISERRWRNYLKSTVRRGLTLMQVILSAGGVGPKAKFAEIARDDGKGFLVPTRFKLKEIASGKAMDPVLTPGDRISIWR